jgi:hypothetical protein
VLASIWVEESGCPHFFLLEIQFDVSSADPALADRPNEASVSSRLVIDPLATVGQFWGQSRVAFP